MTLFDNTDHLHDIPTNIGIVTFIQTTRQNRPKGLKKPYEYILPLKKANALYEGLRNYIKPKAAAYQCALVSKKGLSKGIKLGVFLLGYKPGLCGPGDDGVLPNEWVETCNHVQDLLTKYLGEDAKIYADEYTEDEKFQVLFETYIAYKELL